MQHEASLGKRAFNGIDQQDGAVDHVHDPLNFAAEVGVAWGVNNVDFNVAQQKRGVFRGDRDSALSFLGVGVHHPFRRHFVGLEGTGLFQQVIDEGGFAVVNVRDDAYVANIARHKFLGAKGVVKIGAHFNI